MTQFLPPNLLALFAPRDPIPFLPQLEKLPHEKHHNQPYSGIAPFIRHFEDPRDAPPPTRAETREERLERKRREKIERRQAVVETELKLWDPHNDPNAQGDAFKTLFVARVVSSISLSVINMVLYNKRTGKPRGYAFIEYEHERDMHSAYKHADGKKIDGRRVLVDVERGRTVKGWHPRRLGQPLVDHSNYHWITNRLCSAVLSDRERGDRRERSRDRDKDRERRRSRSRERRRRTRSRERERERERGGATGGDSRSRERSRDRKRRSRSRDRKRDRERGKGLDGEELGQADGAPEAENRILEEHEAEVGEGLEERRDRDRDRDRRRSHRDRDRRRGDRDRDREHKRERGDRDRGERREERHGAGRDEMGPQDELGPEEDGAPPQNMEEYSQDGMMMDQQSVPSADCYASSENGYKMEAPGDEY
uniref:U1 small nuclear ribonucleoprotein 70 kDa n=1 Tax=Amphiprion percula TaxID=161767 RepID=A0A3P8S974_AMPPE